MADSSIKSREVEVTAHDLPLHCPPPGSPVWMMHPRVFLDVAAEGSTLCPYCSTLYTYQGAPPAGH